MIPSRPHNGALVDLLDRVLDKGLVLQADLIISLAGVPLIGVCLRAALASMETMLRYGLMTDWDEKSRIFREGAADRRAAVLLEGEQAVYKGLGACRLEGGLYKTWQYGHVYVTSRRLLIHQEIFDRVLLEIPLGEIRSVSLEPGEEGRGTEVTLQLRKEEVRRVRAADPMPLLSALETTMEQHGLRRLMEFALPT